jgi:hypothetical protein
MAESFDPYHVWLGIPREDQPPNHYRLLGIRQFESNRDVIDNMADQRMTHLRTFQTGKNSKHSQKLLNEVAAARLCLLGEKTKQEYDQKLRASLAPPSGASLAPQPGSPSASQSRRTSAAAAPPPPLPLSRESLRRTPAPPTHGRPASQSVAPNSLPAGSSSARRRSLYGPLVGGSIALIAVIGLGIGYAVMKQHEQPPSDIPSPANSQTVVSPTKGPEQSTPGAPAPAILVFNSGVVGAERGDLKLWVDDKPIPPAAGETREFTCLPGQHRIRAIRPGYKPFETVATAVAGQRQPINFEWHSATALQFKWPLADRQGAVLTIDGRVEPLDAVDLEFPLSPGPHQIRIVRRGFRVQTKTVDMTPAGVPPLIPQWIPVPAERPVVAQNTPTPKEGKSVDSVAPPQRNSDPDAGPTPRPIKVAGNDGPPVKPSEKTDNKEPKLAVPEQAAQAAATKTIQNIYRDDIKRAVTNVQKIELAKKLRTDGVGTADDPVGRFVLLKMARDLAVAGGDLDIAGEVLDDVADRYEVDRLETKTDLLISASKSPQHPDDCSARLNALADDAVAADRYDLAKRALAAALTFKDPALHKQTLIHHKEITETEVEFHRLKPTLDALKADPDDPAANLAVGKFDCLVKGNFEVGLPLLAKGSDKALAELAKLDLGRSFDSGERIKVADGWWDTGKRAARMRAKAIYESELSRLNGISRARIEKRLQELETKSGVESWTNLLRYVDPDKNAIRGQWAKSGDGLQCTQATWGQVIAVPFEAGANYETRIEFTRLTGSNDVMLFLPVAGNHVRVTLGVNDRWGGIDRIDNQIVMPNGVLARPAPLENNKRYVLDVAVRTSADGATVEIFVRVNGIDFTSFQGQATQLTGLPYGWRLPNTKWLGLGVSNSTALFHSAQYRKLPPRAGGR